MRSTFALFSVMMSGCAAPPDETPGRPTDGVRDPVTDATAPTDAQPTDDPDLPVADRMVVRVTLSALASVPMVSVPITLGGMQATTDDHGVATFARVPPDERFVVSAFPPGAPPIYDLAVSSAEHAVDVALWAPEPARVRLADASAGGRVTAHGLSMSLPAGSVVGAGGAPVDAPLEVLVSLADSAPELAAAPPLGIGATRVEAASAFDVSLVADGDLAGVAGAVPFAMVADLQGRTDLSLFAFDPVAGRWVDEGPLAVNGNEVRGSFQHFSWYAVGSAADTERYGCVSGTARTDAGLPLVGAAVSASTPDGRFEASTSAGADGAFCVQAPPDAEILVKIAGWSGSVRYVAERATHTSGDASVCGEACTDLGELRGEPVADRLAHAPVQPECLDGAVDTCGDGLDQDCDGTADDGCATDRDGDGWDLSVDCDDWSNTIHPGAPELCDGRDSDCDGYVDLPLCPKDADLDGVPATEDCDDADPRRSPRVAERCGDGVDQDCDAFADEGCGPVLTDADADGMDAAVDCDDARADVGPGFVELCDGVDNDCDRIVDDGCEDRDLDGVAAREDCDDQRPDVRPGAPEVCDRVDNNCDRRVDEGCALDADGDGYLAGVDCVDADPLIHPGAPERCNNLDDDCDGDIDGPVPTDARTWYADEDGDGWGRGDRQQACGWPVGFAARDGDCADSDPSVSPGRSEVCGNGIDDDCSGFPDDTCGVDADGDGYDTSADCDDSNAEVRPRATERCNAVDDDCNGLSDDLAADASPWFADMDGDGVGGAWLGAACEAPAGAVSDGGDCDDTDRQVRPSALEVCNGRDDDCDSSIDEDAFDALDFFADDDGDGVGGAGTLACAAPPGHVDLGGDCDDSRGDIHPGAPERCDGADQDCDGDVDEEGLDFRSFWLDIDGDGFGGIELRGCDQPEGTVLTPGDCDDSRAAVQPGAIERCDGLDQDCDGEIDESPMNGATGYLDADGDGWGTGAEIRTCDRSLTLAAQPGDCDDGRRDRSPDAVESCDGVDEDCDGEVDEQALDALLWHPDRDGDGVGAGDPKRACAAPPDHVAVAGDCDDRRPEVAPGRTERCNTRDDDCDGDVDEDAVDRQTYFVDRDSDGVGGAAVLACAAPPDAVSTPGDCDDLDPGIRPERPERCDGVDQDCDGVTDEDAVDGFLTFRDEDGDGVGAGAARKACADVPGRARERGDCRDDLAAVHPGAPEVCDGIDQDCNGRTDDAPVDGERRWPDRDSDGFGDSSSASELVCPGTDRWSSVGGDCDDTRASRRPGATEACNNVDDDCDGIIDRDTCPSVEGQDEDADGHAWPEDCDDWDPSVHPEAVDDCDGRDQDCDEAIDESCSDGDADADGLSDGAELELGTNPGDPDSDAGGEPDGAEVGAGRDPRDPRDDVAHLRLGDADSDGLPDVVELRVGTNLVWEDSDRGGEPDLLEFNAGRDPLDSADDAPAATRALDVDGDGLYPTHELTLGTRSDAADSDGGGSADGVEYALGLDPLDPADDDAALPTDADHDGLSDALESYLWTYPHEPDSDGGGMLDGAEARVGKDPKNPDDDMAAAGFDVDQDGLSDFLERLVGTNRYAPDTDGGGMNDGLEFADDRDPLWPGDDVVAPDRDLDGLSDDEEAARGTNPDNPDTDGGGENDGSEVGIGRDPLNPWDDWGGVAADRDRDGLSDALEPELGTNPDDPDTDGGGEPDGAEVAIGHDPLDPSDDAHTEADSDADGAPDWAEYVIGSDPFDPDTDGGGESDLFEWSNGRDPLDAGDDEPASTIVDSDGDHLSDSFEATLGSNPRDADSDGGGEDDASEVLYGRNLLNPADDVVRGDVDRDGDGLSDAAEVELGTDPHSADTDGGGEWDGAEVAVGRDPNNPLDDAPSTQDQDQDGLPNVTEAILGTDPYDADSDGGGEPDGWEWSRGRNPMNAADDQPDAGAPFDLDRDGLDDSFEMALGTDPNLPDSDGGGEPDGAELVFGRNPSDPLDDATPLDPYGDFDGDGLRNAVEVAVGTHPRDPDTDGDGYRDGFELLAGKSPFDPSEWLGDLPDSDRDGLDDLLERWLGADVYAADTDAGGQCDAGELAAVGQSLWNPEDDFSGYGTSSADPDEDEDGLSDDDEDEAGTDAHQCDSDQGGRPDGWEFWNGRDPLDPADDYDADLDGLLDAVEWAIGSDPFDPDSDGAGEPDADEVMAFRDPTNAEDDVP